MTYPANKELNPADPPVIETTLSNNASRKGKFATRTSITEINGEKVIYKTALTKEAQIFLKRIVENEKKNIDYLKPSFEVLCGSLEDNRITYKHLPYKSLQDNMASDLRKRDHNAANQLFQSYVDKLYSLPREQAVPKDFFKTIVGNDDCNKEKIDCLSKAVLDLIPQNILIDNEKWIVIDNEWSFDFPVPIAFILFRAIRTLAISLQIDIRKATCKGNPAISMFKLGFGTFYIPESWMKSICDDKITILQMHQWEMGFQKYILGKEVGHANNLEIKPKGRTHFSKASTLMTMLKKRARTLPVIRQLFYILHRITFRKSHE